MNVGDNMLICVAGKSGSGKSEFAKRLALKDKRFLHLDLDKICHGLYTKKEIKESLREIFGDSIFEKGAVDRKKIGSIVFNDCIKMMQLTDLIWKELEKYVDAEIEEHPDKWLILDAIKIDQVKYFENSKMKILLDMPIEVRMGRVTLRDHIDFDTFMEIDKNSPLYSNIKFDYVVTTEDIDPIIDKIYDATLSS